MDKEAWSVTYKDSKMKRVEESKLEREGKSGQYFRDDHRVFVKNRVVT